MKAIINGKLFLGNRFYEDKILIISEKKILDIVSDSKLQDYPQAEIIDAKGGYVVPGFIDLQLNGCGGVLFNDDISLNTLKIMNLTNLKSGCTSFLPTLITTSDKNMIRALELMTSLKNKEDYGILGLHLEGPYISLEKKGIHNPKFIRSFDEVSLKRILQAKDVVKIITLAPEKVSGEIINSLSKAGIFVSIGHSNASYEEIKEKEYYGLKLATHLYNGMSSFSHRSPGVVEAIFDSDICAGIIVDGFHSHYSSVKIASELMKERLFLVTDAVSPVGTDMEYFYFEGNKVYYKDGKCFGEDGTLGGSALTMDVGIKNLVKYCGKTIEEAIRMATLYPAKAIKIDNQFGKLEKNYFADIVILNEDLNVVKVIFKGKVVENT